MAEQNGPDLSQPPTQKILAMRNQNLSNNEIIQSLQKEGYNSNVILDGMNQADMKANVEEGSATKTDNPDSISNPVQQPAKQASAGAPQKNSQQPTEQKTGPQGPPQPGPANSPGSSQQPPQTPPADNQAGPHSAPDFDMPSTDKLSMKGNGSTPPPMGGNEQSASPYQGADQVTIERIEEIAEAIIDEKWNEIVKSINKIIDWKERTENNINKLEQRFEDLKKEFDNLNKGVLGKIGEYDKNLGNLGVEIKAMERVFQKIIPTMTENVHALQKLTERLEGTAPKEKK